MSYGVEALLKQRDEIDSELRKHKAPVTVMFTDLAGSTSYFDRFGDTAGVQWIEEHNQIVIPLVKQYGGTLVKTIGDSVMAYFTDPMNAAFAARGIQQMLHASNKKKSQDSHMFIRVALHQGLGYLRGGDVFGDVVNVTARIAKACLPAQILTSESIYLTLQHTEGLEFNSQGTAQFQGKSSTESAFELIWTDPKTYAELRQRFPPKVAPQREELSEGRYQVISELGRGAMGVVYKVFDRVIGRTVAMKTIPLEVPLAEREGLVQRLKQEARTAGILDHPNIIMVFDVGEEAGLFYFTMQYVEGRTLSTVLAEKELLPLTKLFEIADQMCSALGFAHQQGIIHRDLKPANMMLTSQGIVKILDFGIAKLGDAGLTKTGAIVGTPSYLSPEQAGGRRLDHRSDIFSLGAVLYELLTGERAFAGESITTIIFKVLNEEPIPPSAIEPSLPAGLDAVVRKAMSKDPKQRFQNCEEMRQALQSCWTNLAVTPIPATKKFAALGDDMPTAAGTLLGTQPATPSFSKAVWGSAACVVILAVGLGMFLTRGSIAKSAAPSYSPATAVASAPEAVKPATTNASSVAAPIAQPEPISPVVTAAPATAVPKSARRADRSAETVPVRASKRANAAAKAAGGESAAADSGEDNTSEPQRAGMFSRGDIPDLLAKADTYAGRGDYDKAMFLYQEIIRVDPKNAEARDGMKKVRDARGIRR
jgi:eukaryotic-like serine/threonine-protein kinase